MTSIDRLTPTASLGAISAAAGGDARSLAAGAIGAIGERLGAWASVLSGGVATGSFQPNQGELARGGDVYELRQLSGELGDRVGASPTEHGELLRAIEGFARAAAVQIHGLGGDAGQSRGIEEARATADAADAPEGVDGVIHRLGVAAGVLEAQNGG